MRRILFLSACTLLLAACSQSPKEKAEALIKDNLQSHYTILILMLLQVLNWTVHLHHTMILLFMK